MSVIELIQQHTTVLGIVAAGYVLAFCALGWLVWFVTRND